jgi:hypothetical protein
MTLIVACVALLLSPSANDSRVAAVEALLNALDAKSPARVTFEHDARTQWNYLPGDRVGLPLSKMTSDQRSHAMEVLRSLLSRQGFETATGIFLLDAELRDRAAAAGRPNASRDPDQYAWAIWGRPGEAPWGVRIEGHHLSLNFTSVDDAASMTPLFLGAAPLQIDDGLRQGTAPLQHIERIALALRTSLTAEQAAVAVLSQDKPHDVLLRPGRETSLKENSGLRADTLSGPQRAMLMRLISAYAGLLAPDLGAQAQRRLLKQGPGGVYFAWIGGTSTDEPRYWRLHGHDWVIEFDSVGDDPGHVHTVWHDLRGNFGADLLLQHLDHEH